ncbi:MAG: phosphotransferase, partial [Candidatus Korarchaeota archaeon]
MSLSRLLDEYYGIKKYSVKFLGGRMNENWLIQTQDDSFVLRHQKYRPLGMEYILGFCDFLKYMGMPVAKPIPNRYGKYMTAYENNFFVLFTFAKGRVPKTITTKLLDDMAKILSQMHRAGVQWSTLHPPPKVRLLHKRMRDAFTHEYSMEYPAKSFLRYIMWPFYRPATSIAKKIDEKIANIQLPCTIIHGDFHRGNLLVNEHGEITALLDFDNSVYGYRVYDIATAVAWMIIENTPTS